MTQDVTLNRIHENNLHTLRDLICFNDPSNCLSKDSSSLLLNGPSSSPRRFLVHDNTDKPQSYRKTTVPPNGEIKLRG